jgi:hypothetical protein
MRTRRLLIIGVVLVWAVIAGAAGEPATRQAEADQATALADQVMKASGAERWPQVKRVEFTFNVDVDGKAQLVAKHDWDLVAGTDAVTWNGQTVIVKLADPNQSEQTKAAFQRWTNDSYWLLAPLKLRDAGVKLSYQGERQEEGKGKKSLVLHVSFERVGLTPTDQYNLYIDPETHLLRAWDYIPEPRKKMNATWFAYRTYDGLTLATDHMMGDKHIFFTDVYVFFTDVYVNQKGPADIKGE